MTDQEKIDDLTAQLAELQAQLEAKDRFLKEAEAARTPIVQSSSSHNLEDVKQSSVIPEHIQQHQVGLVKVPSFTRKNPRGWFLILEAQFRIQPVPITRPQTKFDHAVAHLPDDLIDLM